MNAPNEAILDTKLFITVPEITLPNGTVVPSFSIGKYACTKGDDGKAIIAADRAPWVNINYNEAREACSAIGCQLITELQWLALAHDIAQQECNWNTGIVGKGRLFQGLRLGSVDCAQAGNFEPEDPDEQRWLTLSNGERICDLNGNVYSWVFDNVQGDNNGIVSSEFSDDSPSITTAPFPSRTKGMGDYEVWDWSGRALIRGGYWHSEAYAGVFNLYYVGPGYRYDGIGFRCTKSL